MSLGIVVIGLWGFLEVKRWLIKVLGCGEA